MDRYCPECNSTMTPSLVGHLCTECGHMQRFYTASAVAPTALDEDRPAAPAPQTPTSFDTSRNSDTPEQKKIRSTLKRLMVPELSPPHHHQLISDETSHTAVSAPISNTLDYHTDQSSTRIVAGPSVVRKSKTWIWVVATIILVTAAALGSLYLLSPSMS